MAVLLNLLFNEFRAGNPPRGTGSVFANAPVRAVRYESLEHLQDHLQEGDTVKDGKLVDCDGNPVPVITAAGEIIDTRICRSPDGAGGASAH
jgi:NCS2 family nucleobase:cation symporter-2